MSTIVVTILFMNNEDINIIPGAQRRLTQRWCKDTVQRSSAPRPPGHGVRSLKDGRPSVRRCLLGRHVTRALGRPVTRVRVGHITVRCRLTAQARAGDRYGFTESRAEKECPHSCPN
jgi:hypothetical protein